MIRRGLAITLAIAAVLAALPVAAQARSSDVVDANVHLSLAPDSSLLVQEVLTFDYQGSFEGSYRDILLKHGERMTDIQVSENGQPLRPGGNTALGSHDQPGVFGATSIPEGARIVWHYRATDEKRTWTISYRVIGGAVAYDDVLDVNWQVWGDQWDFDLDQLRADLADPALKQKDRAYRVWGHPRDVEGETSRDAGAARLEASDVPDGQFVEMRVTVPRQPGQDVSGARQGQGDGLPKILEEEQGADDDFNSPFQRAKRWLAGHAVTTAAGLAALALLVMFLLRFLAREHPVSTPKHVPEPPDDASPALAYGLAHEGTDSADTVLATLLDLIERGFYTTKGASTEGEKLDLSVSKSAERPGAEGLAPHEKEVLSFFDELLQGETVPLSEMKDRIPEHDSTWRSRWESMTESLDSADEGELEWDRNLNPVRGLVTLGLLLGIGIVVAAFISVEGKLPILPIVIGVLALVFGGIFTSGTKLKRLSPKYRERSSKWQAFQQWTEDFPRLEDDPPATLELWKRILIFGVAFGTADRMIESGRIPAPVLESSTAGTWNGYMFTGGSTGSGGSFDFGGFSSGFASQVAPESSSGGGGGFSGGGGGGSGGGGGGSW